MTESDTQNLTKMETNIKKCQRVSKMCFGERTEPELCYQGDFLKTGMQNLISRYVGLICTEV